MPKSQHSVAVVEGSSWLDMARKESYLNNKANSCHEYLTSYLTYGAAFPGTGNILDKYKASYSKIKNLDGVVKLLTEFYEDIPYMSIVDKELTGFTNFILASAYETTISIDSFVEDIKDLQSYTKDSVEKIDISIVYHKAMSLLTLESVTKLDDTMLVKLLGKDAKTELPVLEYKFLRAATGIYISSVFSELSSIALQHLLESGSKNISKSFTPTLYQALDSLLKDSISLKSTKVAYLHLDCELPRSEYILLQLPNGNYKLY